MRIHFIAIGGSAMHNMAIALHKKGYQISGSDDEIFEPSKSRLANYQLLPQKNGWDVNNITKDLDAVILGMHAKADNPELLAAKKMGIKVFSYPEYIYEQSKDKKRIVIAGSHGKTSITSMVLHVLQEQDMEFDYLVGAQIEGFETMVKLSEAPIIIMEGDEYLSSPIDRRPKFLWYKPHAAVISGIAWDHINVFPTFENYVEQFRLFIDSMESNATLIYFKDDPELNMLVENCRKNLLKIPYQAHPSKIKNNKTILIGKNNKIPIQIFGNHNLQNLSAALHICNYLAISDADFYKAIQTFKGAAKRLELIAENNTSKVYKDFAHSPSKLKASTQAVKSQYTDKQLIACMELHTFSSLTKEFLTEYSGTMDAADEAIVYYNPKTIAHKGLQNINKEDIRKAFLPSTIKVFDESTILVNYLKTKNLENSILLLMTSGNFDGINLNEFGKTLLSQY